MKQAVCLKFLENKLDLTKNNRCNHNYIVAGNYIKSIVKKGKGLMLTMLDYDQIPVSGRKKDQFIAFLTAHFPDLLQFLE